MTIPAALLPLLPDSMLPVIQYALEHRAYVTLPPRGKRSLEDVANMITTCVVRMQQAESECPTAQDYGNAQQAEATALADYQALRNHADTHIRQAAKKAFEDAELHRIQVGGAMVGAESVIRRMSALIAGELQGLQAVERLAA